MRTFLKFVLISILNCLMSIKAKVLSIQLKASLSECPEAESQNSYYSLLLRNESSKVHKYFQVPFSSQNESYIFYTSSSSKLTIAAQQKDKEISTMLFPFQDLVQKYGKNKKSENKIVRECLQFPINESHTILIKLAYKYDRLKEINGEFLKLFEAPSNPFINFSKQKQNSVLGINSTKLEESSNQIHNEENFSNKNSKSQEHSKQNKSISTAVPSTKVEVQVINHSQNKIVFEDEKVSQKGKVQPEIETKQQQMEVKKVKTQRAKERINFYKGACHRKNLFSCLDAEMNEEEIVFLQPSYI